MGRLATSSVSPWTNATSKSEVRGKRNPEKELRRRGRTENLNTDNGNVTKRRYKPIEFVLGTAVTAIVTTDTQPSRQYFYSYLNKQGVMSSSRCPGEVVRESVAVRETVRMSEDVGETGGVSISRSRKSESMLASRGLAFRDGFGLKL